MKVEDGVKAKGRNKGFGQVVGEISLEPSGREKGGSRSAGGRLLWREEVIGREG